MLDRVIAGPPRADRQRRADVPPELAAIVGKAMARDARRALRERDAARRGSARASRPASWSRAHAYTPWQLVRKKLAQHRGVVAVALASAVALGAVGVESFHTVVGERDIARGERGRAGAAGLAGLVKLRDKLAGKTVAIILSGSNIDAATLRRIVDGEI